MQLKEAKKRQKPWESELTRLVLIVHAGLALVCTWHYQAAAQPLGDWGCLNL